MKNQPQRGFKELIGETIKKIDASSLNVIHIECESGKVVSVDTEEHHYGIPVISAYDPKKYGY